MGDSPRKTEAIRKLLGKDVSEQVPLLKGIKWTPIVTILLKKSEVETLTACMGAHEKHFGWSASHLLYNFRKEWGSGSDDTANQFDVDIDTLESMAFILEGPHNPEKLSAYQQSRKYELYDKVIRTIMAVATMDPSNTADILDWVRKNCKVIYWPGSGEYPMEHAPHVKKDMWDMIVAQRHRPVSPQPG